MQLANYYSLKSKIKRDFGDKPLTLGVLNLSLTAYKMNELIN